MGRIIRIGMIVVAAGAGAAMLATAFTPWTLSAPATRARIVADMERSSGLTVAVAGRMRLRLLPRPTIDIDEVAIRGAGGAVVLDAESMRGRLRLSSLWGGGSELTSVNFESPTVTIDLDRLQPLLEAATGAEDHAPLLRLLQTPGVKLRSAVVRLKSQDRHRDMLFTDLTAAFEWPAGGAEASLSGVGNWHGVPCEAAIDIDAPERLLGGGQALASIHFKSPALNLDAAGTLFGAGDVRATGKLTATTPDLPRFLRLIGRPAPQVDSVREARLSGTASTTGDALSLDDATLGLDDMVFEGALAMRRHGERASLAGTLATDHLDLDRFLAPLPRFLDADGGWSRQPLDTSIIAYDDIDLRVSATTAKLGSFTHRGRQPVATERRRAAGALAGRGAGL